VKHYTAKDDRYLIRTHTTTTAKEQAAHLARSYGSVKLRRRKLMARGKIAPTTRVANRRWNEDEKAAVELLLQQGKNIQTVAQAIGRSQKAISDLLRRNNQTVDAIRDRRGARVRSVADIARLFFVHCHTPARWIARGWLQAERNAAHARHGAADWLLTDAARQAFIELREGWVAWEPSQISDVAWRTYAANIRARSGGKWLSMADVAARYHVGATTVCEWYRQGKMAGVASVKYTHRYFWSADLKEARP
jgi:transposase